MCNGLKYFFSKQMLTVKEKLCRKVPNLKQEIANCGVEGAVQRQLDATAFQCGQSSAHILAQVLQSNN
jgi:hypothetical protein